MSEDTYTEPGITKTFHPDQDKESIVDIYVSAESLRVYDSPWLEEGTLQNVTRPAVAQHPGMDRFFVSIYVTLWMAVWGNVELNVKILGSPKHFEPDIEFLYFQVSVVSASSWRRNCSRTNSAIQCVVYLLLLVLIVVLICLRDQREFFQIVFDVSNKNRK